MRVYEVAIRDDEAAEMLAQRLAQKYNAMELEEFKDEFNRIAPANLRNLVNLEQMFDLYNPERQRKGAEIWARMIKNPERYIKMTEDWGSSDWTAAINSLKQHLTNVSPGALGDIADAAYQVANFYNDDRHYTSDQWSHFTPKQLLRAALARHAFPDAYMSAFQLIINGQLDHQWNYELG